MKNSKNIKEDLLIRAIRIIYSVQGDLDEYSLSEINRFGNNSFMYMYMVWLISFIALFITGGNTDVILFAYLAMLLPSFFMGHLIRRLGLNRLEVERHELKEARRYMLRKTLLQALFILIATFVGFMLAMQFHVFPDDGFYDSMSHQLIGSSVAAVILSILFFIIFAVYNLFRIRIIDNN